MTVIVGWTTKRPASPDQGDVGRCCVRRRYFPYLGERGVLSGHTSAILDHVFEGVQAHPPTLPGDDRERRPPVPVRVDLSAVFAVPAVAGVELADGWDMEATVDGNLVGWRRDTRGRWWGEVRLHVQRGVNPREGRVPYIWWVPANAVSPR